MVMGESRVERSEVLNEERRRRLMNVVEEEGFWVKHPLKWERKREREREWIKVIIIMPECCVRDIFSSSVLLANDDEESGNWAAIKLITRWLPLFSPPRDRLLHQAVIPSWSQRITSCWSSSSFHVLPKEGWINWIDLLSLISVWWSSRIIIPANM